jgi:hypothetical protein
MIIKSLDHLLSGTDSVSFLRVNQDVGNPSQTKTFHAKPFVQVVITVYGDILSFHGKDLFALAELPPPKKDVSFLHRGLVVDILQAITDYQELGCPL